MNNPPNAANDSKSTPQGQPVQINVLVNDSDPDAGDAPFISGKTNGTRGTVSCTLSVCTYTPAAGFTGQDTFTYTIADGKGGFDTATVTVTVNNIPCTSGTFTSTDVPKAIPDFNTTGITSVLPIDGNGVVESLSVSLNIQHTYQGDLIVELVSPAGTAYRLHSRTGGTTDNLIITDRALPATVGQTINGTWSLRVSDRARVDIGSLTAWSLNLVGRCQ